MLTGLTDMFNHAIHRDIQALRVYMKKSPYKIMLRVFLLLQFSAIFIYYFYRDIGDGHFTWNLAGTYILIFIPVGFLLSFIVPIRADTDLQAVTFSLDKVYLFLIWFLVIFKLLASYYYHTEGVADIIMAAIIGIMSGRLTGIILRVRKLKEKHNWV